MFWTQQLAGRMRVMYNTRTMTVNKLEQAHNNEPERSSVS